MKEFSILCIPDSLFLLPPTFGKFHFVICWDEMLCQPMSFEEGEKRGEETGDEGRKEEKAVKGVKDALEAMVLIGCQGRFSFLLSVSWSLPPCPLLLLSLRPHTPNPLHLSTSFLSIRHRDSQPLPQFVPLVLCLFSVQPPPVISVSFCPFCLLNWFDVWPPSNCAGTVCRTR